MLTPFLKRFGTLQNKRSLKDEVEKFQDGIRNGVKRNKKRAKPLN